jgi:hypothetical protein
MPIRTRVRRLWRALVDWWSAPKNTNAPPPSQEPSREAPVSRRTPTPRSADRSASLGEQVIGGAVTVRMWIVGGRLVLATSPAEAERAFVTLLGELTPEERQEARPLLDALRQARATAA